MPKRRTSYRARLLERLTNPEEAANYLNAAIEDSHEVFLEALKDVSQANQMASVAKQAGVTRENLYRSFSKAGNPTLDTLRSVLSVLKLKLVIAPETAFSETSEEESPEKTQGYVYKKITKMGPVQIRVNAASAGQLNLQFADAITGKSPSAGWTEVSRYTIQGKPNIHYVGTWAHIGMQSQESHFRTIEEQPTTSNIFAPELKTGTADALSIRQYLGL